MYKWSVYLEIRVLGIGSRWADRNRSMIAASRDGGNMSNRGLSGLFKIFLKKNHLDFPYVRVTQLMLEHC